MKTQKPQWVLDDVTNQLDSNLDGNGQPMFEQVWISKLYFFKYGVESKILMLDFKINRQ